MASNLSRLKGLGAPPSMEDAPDLAARSEQAPPAPEPRKRGRSPQQRTDLAPPPPERPKLLDGRSLLRTGRTVNFSTRVTYEWSERLRDLAQRQGVMMVEILEAALDALEEKLGEERSN
jgi:hypothetical protein